MFNIADYELPNLVSIAGATIALIISGAIFLQGFHNKHKDITERYRGLTAEYRLGSGSDLRRGSLRGQILSYYRRIRLLNYAALLVGVALLAFIMTVTVAGLSVLYPHLWALKVAGTLGLFAGLMLIATAVCLDLVETFLSRPLIGQEVEDFDDVPKPEETTIL